MLDAWGRAQRRGKRGQVKSDGARELEPKCERWVNERIGGFVVGYWV